MSDIREMEVKWNGVTEYQTTGQEKGIGKLVVSFIDSFLSKFECCVTYSKLSRTLTQLLYLDSIAPDSLLNSGSQ